MEEGERDEGERAYLCVQCSFKQCICTCTYVLSNFVPTGSLRSVLCDVCYDGVCTLYSEQHQWENVVFPNVRHVIRGVVRGTAYLHEEMHIQHVDLKSGYILSCTCYTHYMYCMYI